MNPQDETLGLLNFVVPEHFQPERLEGDYKIDREFVLNKIQRSQKMPREENTAGCLEGAGHC